MAELDELGKDISAFDADSRYDFELKVYAVFVGGMLTISYFCAIN